MAVPITRAELQGLERLTIQKIRDDELERFKKDVRHDDEAFHPGQALLQHLQERHEAEVGEDPLILGMIDDVAQLIGEEPGIECVDDRAKPHDAVPDLEVAPCVPRHGGDDRAQLEAELRLAGRCQRAGAAA